MIANYSKTHYFHFTATAPAKESAAQAASTASVPARDQQNPHVFGQGGADKAAQSRVVGVTSSPRTSSFSSWGHWAVAVLAAALGCLLVVAGALAGDDGWPRLADALQLLEAVPRSE